MLLKGGLHIHTTCSDGDLSVVEVISLYESMGFDFIALTDHDYLLKKGCYDVVKHIKTDMLVFTGVEMTVFEKGYVHVNKIYGDSEILHIFNHPGELDLPLEKVIERIKAVSERIPIDAVEVTSKGFRTPEYENDAIEYPKVATDDSHTKIGCGRAWIEMDCAKDKDSIIRAVKHGDFWNCYADTKQIRKMLFL